MDADIVDYSKIAIFGPHDRMNYGDLLFALMLDFAFSKKIGKQIKLNKYSIVKSDLTHKGAFESKSYKELVADIDYGKIDVIIVAGGESLGATWARLYSFINPIYSLIYERTPFATSKYIYPIIKKMLGAKSEYPFLINKKDFKKEIKVLYNSVGGLKYVISEERIKEADYFAIRDSEGYSQMQGKFTKLYVYPDSAIIMSDVIRKNYLETALKDQKLFFNNYVFFQISKFKIQNDLDQTVFELLKILNNSNYNIVLCPIGTAKGHEDHVILQQIYERIGQENNRVTIVSNPNVESIMGLIAFSSFYIGTSLHGVITAMSFGVKYIGLNPEQTKLYNYIKTWSGLDADMLMAKTGDFYDCFVTVDALDNILDQITQATQIQKQKYYESVDNLIAKLLV
ncbi:polysaccharide pyruvyl transferase family protein [Epilithonimonas hungarica]|uniref:Polysaccharide pyruvyl transferase n=1 Tax=Epilithonimonas hungarica TaxID=454006 RepID=A0A1G7GGW2_9FLAO|nr:polysaccharide pyruvyl transferase family protein [Epilithonimonas hungarica]SDE87398.1 Polysaccharide pyruvyl transferase [Epilithonimonas hungarica]